MRYLPLLLLLFVPAGCGSTLADSVVPSLPAAGHSDAEMEAITSSRDSIRRQLQADAKEMSRLTAEKALLESADSQLAIEEAQTRFRILAIAALFACGICIALAIYFGPLLGVFLRIGAYIFGAISVLAFCCDWLAPYAWYLGLIIPAAVVGGLIYVLHRNQTANKIVADSWHAVSAELEKHAPDTKARLDKESLAAQAAAGVKSHVDALLHRI